MKVFKIPNITWHRQKIFVEDIESLHGHKGATLWFTGLPASGKSTLANAVATALHERSVSTIVLDGDNIRHGLNDDLGFSPEDRIENIRRVAEVANLFTSAAIVNLVAFISPYRKDRQLARDLQPDSFIEIFCGASLDVCEARDPKGLYKKARDGEIEDFTGIDAPYEIPMDPELHLNTGKLSLEKCVKEVVALLELREVIPSNTCACQRRNNPLNHQSDDKHHCCKKSHCSSM
ncbi:MAG: adenylyl-sulfate kinase [Proteobacteria bacterium]|nr:adenylyl-sulfate kinase [Pseudomonadota bacterium]